MPLTASKYIIFLIGGQFKVGDSDIVTQGVGYLVADEEKIQLQPKTIVVIIDQD